MAYNFEDVFMNSLENHLLNRFKGDVYMRFIGNDTFRLDIEVPQYNIKFKYITGGVYRKCLYGKTAEDFAREITKSYRGYIRKLFFYGK